MNVAPMLADFAIRLAFGLAVSLLLTSWRAVPLVFFRTQAQVILGLLVLAGLDQARAGGPAWAALGPGRRRGHGILRGGRVGVGSAPDWHGDRGSRGTGRRCVAGGGLSVGFRSVVAIQCREPALLRLPAGLDADGHAAGSPLPDGPRHVDRAAQTDRQLDRMGTAGAVRARRVRNLGPARR